jgi:hypothetical protein
MNERRRSPREAMSERSELMAAERPPGIGANRRPQAIAWSRSPICIDRTRMGSGGAAPEER